MRSDYTRIKFYSRQDLLFGSALDAATKFVHEFSNEFTPIDINDILELYNIQLLFNCGVQSLCWSDTEYDEYLKIVNSFSGIIGKYLARVTDDMLSAIYSQVILQYKDDFWTLLVKYNVYKRLSSESFSNCLKANKILIQEILRHKALVEQFSDIILKCLISNPQHAELLIHQFLMRSDYGPNIFYYFPSQLSASQKTDLLSQYVNSENPNPNFLQIILNSSSSAELPLPNKLRVTAKRKFEKFCDEHICKSNHFKQKIIVSASSQIDEPFQVTHNTDELIFTYNRHWIEENTDFPTLLNNFIYIFGFTDSHFRSLFPSFSSRISTLERVMSCNGVKDYLTGNFFHMQSLMFSLQMVSYQQELEQTGYRIEDIIKWFFEVYLKEEFKVENFVYHSPSKECSMLEKIRLIATEIDSVLKQFRIYCENGTIDRELLEIGSEHIIFDQIPSIIEGKYLYIKNEKYLYLLYLLFSDQSMLNHIKISPYYPSFVERLTHESIYIDDCTDHQKFLLQTLVNEGIIELSPTNEIKLNLPFINILRQFYYNEVICYHHKYNQATSKLLSTLLQNDDIEAKSTLFSAPEQDYLNYMLNKSKFSNGMDLRNKYIHGTNTLDEQAQYSHYIEFLKIMILIVIKINDEFCSRELLPLNTP